MWGDGLTDSSTSATGENATKFEMASDDTGAILSLPVAVVSVGTSEPASSERDVRATVSGLNTTASSVPVPLGESAKAHVWNGAVNGDTASTSSRMAHSFVSTLRRPRRALDIGTSIYVFTCGAAASERFQVLDSFERLWVTETIIRCNPMYSDARECLAVELVQSGADSRNVKTAQQNRPRRAGRTRARTVLHGTCRQAEGEQPPAGSHHGRCTGPAR
jgi:hypothetical protein